MKRLRVLASKIEWAVKEIRTASLTLSHHNNKKEDMFLSFYNRLNEKERVIYDQLSNDYGIGKITWESVEPKFLCQAYLVNETYKNYVMSDTVTWDEALEQIELRDFIDANKYRELFRDQVREIVEELHAYENAYENVDEDEDVDEDIYVIISPQQVNEALQFIRNIKLSTNKNWYEDDVLEGYRILQSLNSIIEFFNFDYFTPTFEDENIENKIAIYKIAKGEEAEFTPQILSTIKMYYDEMILFMAYIRKLFVSK